MPRARRIAQNILSNWVALALTTVVGFFLAPYVVHQLGSVVYGVWVIVASLVSYMNLLDLGLQSAVVRFVSKGVAQENHEESCRTISGALWIRLWISLIIVVAGIAVSTGLHRIFVIPPVVEVAARVAVLVSAITVAMNLWCGVFRAVLISLHRYDLTSAILVLQTCARAAGFVALLRAGHGIMGLAVWELATAFAANLSILVLVFRTYPRLKVAFSRPDRDTFRKLWNYSSYVFVINVAVQVVYYTDNLVVGAFLGPAAVTLYAIGGVLVGYARQIVAAMTTTFAPLASTFEAEGKYDNLQRLLIHGTRAALVVSLPIEVALFLRGETFIRLWMGPQFAVPSSTVMKILLLSVVFSSANSTSGGVAYGMEKLKRVTLWAVAEAVANLALSIILVRRIGIYGVAWGTAIPSVIIEMLLWPRYVCRLVSMPVRVYLWQTWFRTAVAILPFALACAVAERFWPASNLALFCLQVAVLLLLIPLGLALVFRSEVTVQLHKWRNRRNATGRLNEYESSTTTVG